MVYPTKRKANKISIFFVVVRNNEKSDKTEREKKYDFISFVTLV